MTQSECLPASCAATNITQEASRDAAGDEAVIWSTLKLIAYMLALAQHRGMRMYGSTAASEAGSPWSSNASSDTATLLWCQVGTCLRGTNWDIMRPVGDDRVDD